MYKLPKDLQKKIKEKFPEVKEIDQIIDSVFTEIINKSFDNGACLIQHFGTFYTYKSFSKRKNKYVPRFKYKISRTLLNQLIDDPYLVQKIEKVMDRVFDTAKSKNAGYIISRKENILNQQLILSNQRKIQEQTEINLVQDEISKILEKNSNKLDKNV